ncbi:MAG: glycosyltransferase family 4 protein [Firmicutes bacterium]|nr:glycosyltransferase family 4 protein [Bacillota bacterium]
MKKIKINMLSMADKVDGQGVGSAYLEQVELVKSSPKFEVLINSKEKTDIVHSHTIEPKNYLKMKFNKGVNVAYCHFLPETLDGSIKLPRLFFNIFKKYVVSFYKQADYLVVVNPIFIDDLARHGVKREKIKYIPNYVSKEQFFKKSKKEVKEIRQRYEIDNDKFVVLGVGQVQTRKGVLDFIEVAKKLPDMQFVWCGGFSFGAITDGYEELKKVYENPPKNVKFLGIIPREQMNDMYNMADVLFMPSYNELFPMSILEAVNSEKPLLLRDLDLYKDILFKKYISGKNNKQFVTQLKKLEDDKAFYKEESIHSKEINQFYSKENVLKIWEEFYTGIVGNKIQD